MLFLNSMLFELTQYFKCERLINLPTTCSNLFLREYGVIQQNTINYI